MKINNIDRTSFGAIIKINKQKMNAKLLESVGSSSVSGGTATMLSGVVSGADMIVHGSINSVPYINSSSSLFERFASAGHEMLGKFEGNLYHHNAYDAAFFSLSNSGAGAITYFHGMNNIVKGIEKNYKAKIPT